MNEKKQFVFDEATQITRKTARLQIFRIDKNASVSSTIFLQLLTLLFLTNSSFLLFCFVLFCFFFFSASSFVCLEKLIVVSFYWGGQTTPPIFLLPAAFGGFGVFADAPDGVEGLADGSACLADGPGLVVAVTVGLVVLDGADLKEFGFPVDVGVVVFVLVVVFVVGVGLFAVVVCVVVEVGLAPAPPFSAGFSGVLALADGVVGFGEAAKPTVGLLGVFPKVTAVFLPSL